MLTSHYLEITVHLASAWIAGSLIGLERSFHGRPAGFRTHALVCLASAVLMMITVYQSDWLTFALPDTIRADPQRMAQGIMTGIGFLGAGVIFKEGLSVRGLTTAASIWITAALGILYGVGFYYPALLGDGRDARHAFGLPLDRGEDADPVLCPPRPSASPATASCRKRKCAS